MFINPLTGTEVRMLLLLLVIPVRGTFFFLSLTLMPWPCVCRISLAGIFCGLGQNTPQKSAKYVYGWFG